MPDMYHDVSRRKTRARYSVSFLTGIIYLAFFVETLAESSSIARCAFVLTLTFIFLLLFGLVVHCMNNVGGPFDSKLTMLPACLSFHSLPRHPRAHLLPISSLSHYLLVGPASVDAMRAIPCSDRSTNGSKGGKSPWDPLDSTKMSTSAIF